MIELRKKFSVDLTNAMFLLDTSMKYEVIDSNLLCEHITTVCDDFKFYELTDNKIIFEYNNAIYYMVPRVEESADSDESFEALYQSINAEQIEIGDDDGENVKTFIEVTKGECLSGTESIIESVETDVIGLNLDTYMKVFQNGEEFLLARLTDGTLYLHTGIEIKKSQVL